VDVVDSLRHRFAENANQFTRIVAAIVSRAVTVFGVVLNRDEARTRLLKFPQSAAWSFGCHCQPGDAAARPRGLKVEAAGDAVDVEAFAGKV
jgi:hypothetical protein